MAQDKKRSFWRKPVGITGGIIIVLILIVLTQLWGPWLELIKDGNILVLTTTLVIIGMIAFILLDKKMRMISSITYRRIIRWVTSWFTDVDPMRILQKRITEMEVNLKQLKRQLIVLAGQRHKLMEQILINTQDIEKHLVIAAEAKNAKNESGVIINTRNAARLRTSNENLTTLLQRIKDLEVILVRMKENSEILLSDVRDQLAIKSKEREAILAGNTAMKSATEILSGGQSKIGEFDLAMEAVADDVSQQVSEMEEYMLLSQSFMRSIDLQKGVFHNDGMAMLENFEKRTIGSSQGKKGRPDDTSKLDELENRTSSGPTKKEDNTYDTLFHLKKEKGNG